MFFLRGLAAWVLILVFAIANGVVREKLLLPLLGVPLAPLASGLILIAAIVAITYLLARWLDLSSLTRRLSLGLMWLTMTFAFETSYGVVAEQKSCADLLDAYTFQSGNIWPVVLFITVAAPFVAAALRSLNVRKSRS